MTPGDPGFNPFPGLRPFDMDEEYLFFGREDLCIAIGTLDQAATLLEQVRNRRDLSLQQVLLGSTGIELDQDRGTLTQLRINEEAHPCTKQEAGTCQQGHLLFLV